MERLTAILAEKPDVTLEELHARPMRDVVSTRAILQALVENDWLPLLLRDERGITFLEILRLVDTFSAGKYLAWLDTLQELGNVEPLRALAYMPSVAEQLQVDEQALEQAKAELAEQQRRAQLEQEAAQLRERLVRGYQLALSTLQLRVARGELPTWDELMGVF